MSIDLCILASGSAGNCALVRTPDGAMLIDAGIGPRTAAKRLQGAGVTLEEVKAICLTHLDRDHFNRTWVRSVARAGIRVFCHAGRREELLALAEEMGEEDEGLMDLFAGRVECFGADEFEPIPGVAARPVALAHDETGSHGFLLEGFGCRVGYATDLGRVPARLIETFAGVDVLAIESNYDPEMQRGSGRPWFLQQRIMGGRGHLSNEQAFDAIRQILDRCQRSGRLPAHIVLLHRSRECNCPKLVREIFSRDARIAERLTLAEQYQRTDWLRPRPGLPPLAGEQLSLNELFIGYYVEHAASSAIAGADSAAIAEAGDAV